MRSRRSGLDKWAMVEAIHVLHHGTNEPGARTPRVPLPATVREDDLFCPECGADIEVLEQDVRCCWPCRRTWRGRP